MKCFMKTDGKVSIFLCIVLIAIIALSGVLIDASRMLSAEVQVKRAVDSAARSLLAGYDKKLKDDYGLFALSGNNEYQLSALLQDYIEKNLIIGAMAQVDETMDIYGYCIENIDIQPVYNLSENGVIRDQILEYMKYRAPKEIVQGMLTRFSVASETGKMCEAYSIKFDADKLLSKMDKAVQKLKKAVDGEDTVGCYINGFNKGGARVQLVDSYISLGIEYVSVMRKLEQAQKDEMETQTQIVDSVEITPQLQEKLDIFKENIEELKDRIKELEDELEDTFEELVHDETEDFLKAHQDALECVDEITRLSSEADSKISELDRYMSENFGGTSEFSDDFKKSVEQDIADLRKLILSAKDANELEDNITGNIQALNDAITLLFSVRSSGFNCSDAEGLRQKLAVQLNGVLDVYEFIDYQYEKPNKGGDTYSDPRKNKGSDVKQALQMQSAGDRDMKKDGIVLEELPSQFKVISKDFELEDLIYTGMVATPEDDGGQGYSEVLFNGDLKKLGEDIDFENEDESFCTNAFGFFSDIAGMLSSSLEALRDEIYINEYTMGCFKNSVPETLAKDAKITQLDLRGNEMSRRNTFFSSEVEYVLHGNTSENTNKLLVQSQILLLRFGLNTLHVYNDPAKKAKARIIAAAVAGWWTGGAGIPLISNLIMCAWGMAEAISDLNELMDGKSLPLYKSAGDWKLDIGIGNSKAAKTDEKFMFSYHDYLRLLLLFVSPAKKLDRIEDLIQVNIGKMREGFRMSDSCTCLRVEAELSIKYLFLTRVFMPVERKTSDGRHKIRTLIYRRY